MGEIGLKWLWVCGWGVSPKALKSWATEAFPGIFHQVILPLRLPQGFHDGFDKILGWSWGGYRVLEWFVTSENRQKAPPIVLFSPFFGFCLEDSQGGKTSRTHVKYLARWMKRDPVAALTDFYQRADLTFPFCALDQECFPFWTNELSHLANEKLDINQVIGAIETTHMQIFVGEKDPLVDAPYLVEKLGAIMVPKVGHDLAALAYFMK